MTGVIPFEQPIDNDISIGLPIVRFRFRAIVEMQNDNRGKQSVIRRLESLLDCDDYVIEKHDIKYGKSFRAKAVAVGDISPRMLINWSYAMRNVLIIPNSKLEITVEDSDKFKNTRQIESASIFIRFVTPTFSADIDIIPSIGTIDKDVFDSKSEQLSEYLTETTTFFANYLGTIVNAKFTKKSSLEFRNILDNISVLNDNIDSLIESNIENSEWQSIAKVYYTLVP